MQNYSVIILCVIAVILLCTLVITHKFSLDIKLPTHDIHNFNNKSIVPSRSLLLNNSLHTLPIKRPIDVLNKSRNYDYVHPVVKQSSRNSLSSISEVSSHSQVPIILSKQSFTEQYKSSNINTDYYSFYSSFIFKKNNENHYNSSSNLENSSILNDSLHPYNTFPSKHYSNFSIFIKDYNDWLLKSYQMKTAHKRYLIFQPNDQGMANKMFGFLSTIFYAMINKRAIFINKWPIFYDTFQSDIKIPLTKKPYNLQTKVYRHCGKKFPKLFTIELDTLNSDNYCFESNCQLLYYFFYNKNFYPRFKEMGIMNDQDQLLINEKTAYHYLVNTYMRPSEMIQKQIDHVRSPWKPYHMIGIHIRNGDKTSFSHQYYNTKTEYSDKYFENYYKKIAFINKAKELSKDKPNYRWFIVTDFQALKDNIIKDYSNMTFYYNAEIKHTGKRGNFELSTGLMDAVIELFLLASCDEHIIASITSYGSIASIISMNPTYVIKL